MLKSTFLHLPGIGPTKERALWRRGVTDWDELEKLYVAQGSFFPSPEIERLQIAIEMSRVALANSDTAFFARSLPRGEHYRIALSFPESTVFLDIETTGLSHYYDEITLVGLGIDSVYLCKVSGHDIGEVPRLLANAKCLVTFNGANFDLRFLRKRFPSIYMPEAHVDLRFLAPTVDLRGGQKKVEAMLGLRREHDIEDVKGETAPLLWHRFKHGDNEAGKRLVSYNHADVEGMKVILDAVLTRIAARKPEVAKVILCRRFSAQRSKLTWATSKSTTARNRIHLRPYRGKRGPQITYSELISGQRPRNLRVVGIDLTGSEKRPSGWCALDGESADTQMLHTDAEIIAATVAAQPDIISIDSPLSLPRGRRSVSDDDKGRYKYGIMRWCERLLKKRGVNVYPALIPSMQQLTARGIRLARTFRQIGLPVIESYPGAAQDIMGIPRKRAGLEYLKEGLADFGVRGSFLREQVTHDEVDAVTSAVVGLFFWSGKFEPLGNEDEDYLIIPDLHASPEGWRKRMVVGVSGPIAAGKTTVAQHLENIGYEYGRFSLFLEKLLRAKKKPVNRDSLQELGEKIHRKPGQRWFAKQLIKSLSSDKNLVIDGLRFPEDHATLVESFGPAFVHIHISASAPTREERYVVAGNSREDFWRAAGHPVEQGVAVLAERAHRQITNEGTVGRLTSAVSRAINANDL